MNDIECVGQVLEIGQLDFEETTVVCEICDKHCINKIHLLEHQKAHVVHVPKRKTYVCDICGFICNRRGHLSKHKRLHDKDQPFACAMCDKVCLSKLHLTAHQQCHIRPKEKPFICNICNYACTRRAHLERHQRRHTKEKPFTCECGKAFSCKGNFVKHQRSHSEEKPFICEICGKGFSLGNYLMVHTKFHHTDQGGFSSGLEDNFLVKEEDVKPPEKVQSHDYPFVCTICGVSFLHKYSLITHHKVHTEKEQYVCNICNEQCKTQIHLAAHQKTHDYPFTCTICGFACKRIGHLTRHERTHTKEKPFTCRFCAKSFACKGNLVKHQSRVHPAETQAEINLQNSHSARRGSPQKRRNIEKASYVCDECGRSFYRKHYLDCHKKIHADEVGFDGLEEHKKEENDVGLQDGPKTPTKEKPHVCDLCGYSCGLRGTMKRHQRIHTNERPFACEMCGKAFSIRWNLKIHKERVHLGSELNK